MVIGVSTQDEASHKEFIEKENLPFDLAVDKEATIAKAFGVPVNVLGMASRQTFLINKEGKIKKIWKQVNPQGHAQEILAAAKNLLDPLRKPKKIAIFAVKKGLNKEHWQEAFLLLISYFVGYNPPNPSCAKEREVLLFDWLHRSMTRKAPQGTARTDMSRGPQLLILGTDVHFVNYCYMHCAPMIHRGNLCTSRVYDRHYTTEEYKRKSVISRDFTTYARLVDTIREAEIIVLLLDKTFVQLAAANPPWLNALAHRSNQKGVNIFLLVLEPDLVWQSIPLLEYLLVGVKPLNTSSPPLNKRQIDGWLVNEFVEPLGRRVGG